MSITITNESQNPIVDFQISSSDGKEIMPTYRCKNPPNIGE
jgi:hypothetical protein